jgi:hypothetical protein
VQRMLVYAALQNNNNKKREMKKKNIKMKKHRFSQCTGHYKKYSYSEIN